MSSAASITSCVRSVNKTSADGRGSRFSSRLLAPAYPVAHRGFSTADGRGFTCRPREFSGVCRLFEGSGGHVESMRSDNAIGERHSATPYTGGLTAISTANDANESLRAHSCDSVKG